MVCNLVKGIIAGPMGSIAQMEGCKIAQLYQYMPSALTLGVVELYFECLGLETRISRGLEAGYGLCHCDRKGVDYLLFFTASTMFIYQKGLDPSCLSSH